MARNPRLDQPGTWHHVMNRAIARRSLFESRSDIRYFLAQIARAVRRNQFEVHAWCVLTTHFHLLVRVLDGSLSAGMRRVQNAYVRHFNRSRRRDGPLVRGRFLSKPVESSAYRALLVRYIDDNPVQAGLANASWEYAWGSARAYAFGSGPRWLSREWVESLVCARVGAHVYESKLYARAFNPIESSTSVQRLVEDRIRVSNASAPYSDPLEDLLLAAPSQVLTWMRRKSALADATSIGEPIVDAGTLVECVRSAREASSNWIVAPHGHEHRGWEILLVGLLRDLAGSSFPHVGATIGRNPVASRRMYELHRRLLVSDEIYADRAAGCADLALNQLRRPLAPSPYGDR